MELYYGAYKSQKVAANLARLKMIERNMEIISSDEKSAEIFGMIKADLEKQGTPLDDFDIMIASCALVHNLTLVTNNIKHFKRIDGLRLVNWTVIKAKEGMKKSSSLHNSLMNMNLADNPPSMAAD